MTTPAATYTVRDLPQVRALGDPRKLRILQAFAEAPKATMQVAEELGEPATALYRHVNALHRLGLLRVVSERRKRGTVERTFQAVARQFAVADEVFLRGSPGRSALRRLFRESERQFFECPPGPKGDRDPLGPVAVGVRMTGTAAEIARFRRQVVALAEKLSRPRSGKSPASDQVVAAALLVFYLVPPSPAGGRAPRRRDRATSD